MAGTPALVSPWLLVNGAEPQERQRDGRGGLRGEDRDKEKGEQVDGEAAWDEIAKQKETAEMSGVNEQWRLRKCKESEPWHLYGGHHFPPHRFSYAEADGK